MGQFRNQNKLRKYKFTVRSRALRISYFSYFGRETSHKQRSKSKKRISDRKAKNFKAARLLTLKSSVLYLSLFEFVMAQLFAQQPKTSVNREILSLPPNN